MTLYSNHNISLPSLPFFGTLNPGLTLILLTTLISYADFSSIKPIPSPSLLSLCTLFLGDFIIHSNGARPTCSCLLDISTETSHRLFRPSMTNCVLLFIQRNMQFFQNCFHISLNCTVVPQVALSRSLEVIFENSSLNPFYPNFFSFIDVCATQMPLPT